MFYLLNMIQQNYIHTQSRNTTDELAVNSFNLSTYQIIILHTTLTGHSVLVGIKARKK